MSTDLRTQLLEYGRYHRAEQQPIELAELTSHRNELGVQVVPVDQLARGRRRRWVWAAVAAIAIGALVGGIAVLLQSTEGQVIDQPTTTVFTPSPTAPGAALEPGLWSIAATSAQPANADQLADHAAAMRTWPGVLEVVEVGGREGWLALTGLDAGDCTPDGIEPPCGPGLVALVVSSQIPLTSQRLEIEFAMTAIEATDVPQAFIEGYLTAVQEQTGLTELRFDPASLGVEQPLAGPIANVAGEECDECELVVQTEVDGFVFVTGLDLDGDPQVGLIHEVSGGGGTGVEARDFYIDSSGEGGAIANVQAQVGGRAVYGFAFLPLDSAVMTFELNDGTSVWQRTIAGMALFVDGPGTASPDGDGGGRVTDRFVVLDVFGSEIMHIQGTPDGTRITDLRIDSTLTDVTQSRPLDVIPATEVAGMTLTWTQAQWPDIRPSASSPSGFLGTGPEGRLWRSTDGSNWEQDAALSGFERISVADAGTHLLLTGTQGDGTTALLRSDDGSTWAPIDGTADFGVDVEVASATPSGLTWLRGHPDGGVIALVDEERIVEFYAPPWNTSDCCLLVDLVEFPTGVVAFVTDFNEPRLSVAFSYQGEGAWSEAVSVPISTSHPQVGNTVLMFDHTNATCCGNPIAGVSEWPLLESSNGLDWRQIDGRPGEDVHALRIRAGDSFWLYGPDIGGGGNNIETDPSRLLWISSDGREWDPIDISFAAPGGAVVLGDAVFLQDGTAITWIGTFASK